MAGHLRGLLDEGAPSPALGDGGGPNISGPEFARYPGGGANLVPGPAELGLCVGQPGPLVDDNRLGAFLDRPIKGEWPYLWIDATSVKVRQDGRIISVAAIVAVNVHGRREVLGMDVGPSQAETT